MGLIYSAAIVAVNLSVHTYNHTLPVQVWGWSTLQPSWWSTCVYTPITVHCVGQVLVYSAAIVAVTLSVHTYNHTLPVLDKYWSE